MTYLGYLQQLITNHRPLRTARTKKVFELQPGPRITITKDKVATALLAVHRPYGQGTPPKLLQRQPPGSGT